MLCLIVIKIIELITYLCYNQIVGDIMNRFVYLDNNATTKVASHIKEKILPYLELQYGNPSSVYGHGVKVKQAINESRESIAKLINCSSNNIVFTSGGTESNCSAFNSAINELSNRKKIITTKVEHGSILKYCGLLEDRGYKVVYLDVDENCKVNMKQLEEEVDENTVLVSIQYANNEVGTILLDDELLYLIKNLKNKYKFKFHTDCVQGFGKVSIDYQKLDADYISFSGHKIHCPKGIGSLYIKEPKFFVPLITGSQEFGLRGGTENVIGIVAMGEACKLLHSNLTLNTEKVKEIRNYLEV